MPIDDGYPTRHIQETTTGVGSIEGAPTSIAAVIGAFAQGPLREARRILSSADLERDFGAPEADTLSGDAIHLFFANGGREIWVVRTEGQGGSRPGGQDLIDALSALDPVDVINLLLIPGTDQLGDADAALVMARATAYAAGRRALYLLDPPHRDVVRDDVPKMRAWLGAHEALRHANAVAYFPRPLVADPSGRTPPRALPASFTIAGLLARVDRERGVWQSAAGRHGTLRGVTDVEHAATDAETKVLTTLGVNVLRVFPATGPVCWGARTLAGADALNSEWKYVPVRRLALFIEESISRDVTFAVFEPNAEPLWAKLRGRITLFLRMLWTQGALLGSTEEKAYFVRCGRDTTTQADIDQGFLNIEVGFAALKPAEFTIIRLRQAAGAP